MSLVFWFRGFWFNVFARGILQEVTVAFKFTHHVLAINDVIGLVLSILRNAVDGEGVACLGFVELEVMNFFRNNDCGCVIGFNVQKRSFVGEQKFGSGFAGFNAGGVRRGGAHDKNVAALI